MLIGMRTTMMAACECCVFSCGLHRWIYFPPFATSTYPCVVELVATSTPHNFLVPFLGKGCKVPRDLGDVKCSRVV